MSVGHHSSGETMQHLRNDRSINLDHALNGGSRHIKDTSSLLRKCRLDPNSSVTGQFAAHAVIVKYD